MDRSYREKIAKDRFDADMTERCTIETKSGIFVQSRGEQMIADWLYENNYDFLYDHRIQIDLTSGEELEDSDRPPKEDIIKWVRPDFRIKDTKIIIEYWGMKYGTPDNPQYDKRTEDKIGL